MARIPSNMTQVQLDDILPRLADHGLPGGGEFLVAEVNDTSPAIIAILVWHGFLPMGGMGLLLPKLHERRCVVNPGDVHIGRKTRRRLKGGFSLTVGEAWGGVVRGIQEHTFTEEAGDCWLSDDLAAAWLGVNKLGGGQRWGVTFHSIELWHSETKELVAGEIGYTCGAVYSSLTGFTLKNKYAGAGSVQLACLGRWLERSGIQLWDLGMELDYKLELGGKCIPRADWVRRVRELRSSRVSLRSPSSSIADAAQIVAREEPPATSPSSAVAAGATDKVLAPRTPEKKISLSNLLPEGSQDAEEETARS